MHSQRFLITGLMLLGAALAAGCGQNIAEDYRFTQLQKEQGYEPDPKAFDAELSLCRAVSRKTGERVGEGDIFAVGASGTAIHYDGTNWTAMTTGTSRQFESVWVSSSDFGPAASSRPRYCSSMSAL